MLPQKSNAWFDIVRLDDGLFGIAERGHFEEVISYLLLGSTYRGSIERILALPKLRRIFCSHNEFELPIAQVRRVQETLSGVLTQDLIQEIKLGDRLRLVPA